jgi:hypothetical protein
MTLSQADIDSLLGPQPADSVESLLDAPLTGEDISLAMQDPSYQPTQDDYLKFEEYSKNKQVDWVDTIAKSVDAAAGMIGGAVAEGAQGAVVNPLNYIEGAAQGTRQLYGLVAQSQDPSSALFRFKDLVAGTGTPESRYNQFLDARNFANTSARLERGEEGIFVPPELTNPEFVQGVSMILDPTLALPGIGEVFGAGKLATRAVGKGTQLAGRAVAGAARPLERFAGAAERMTAEALGMTPEALRTAASTAGVAGALGIAPEAAAFAAIPAGIRTAREAGEALAMAGENLMTQPSRIGPLEAIGAAPGANLRQRMLGVVGQYGGDAALDASLRGLAGAIEGGVIGTGLGYLSGGEEGAAAGLGAGGVQGAAGAIGGRMYQKLTGAAAKEARAGDLGRFIDAQQDPTTKALFERVRDQHGVDTASALMDVEGLVKGRFGDVDVKYLSDTDFVDQYKGRARGVQVEVGDRPTIVINADILGKGKGDSPLYTLGHELFHALEKSEQLAGGATEIKNALVGRWIQEGDVIRKLSDGAFNDAEIEARFNEYRDKLSAGSPQRAAELAQFDTINKKADYIASELAAEHFAALIAGQKPDAMLKGFSGLTRQLLDAALTQNASKAIANAAASIERTFGVKPTDSVLFPDLKQASPQVNAMLRDLVRARRKLDEKIMLDDSRGGRVLKPEDVSNPLAAKELVDLGLAEQMPDGSIRNLSSDEIRARDDKDLTSLRSITEKIPGARMVDGEITGRFSPDQLSAIEQSQTISSRMKDKIRAVNLAIENGNSLFVTYFAALKRVRNKLTKKYSPKYDSGIRVSEREFSPYSFKITKADNPVVNAIDITKVRNELSKLLKKDGSIGGLWSNTDGFMTDLARYFTNLDQREGARRSAEIFGVEKAKFLGDFVGAAEKGGSKFVRSFRLDRVGSMSPMDFKAKFSEEAYQLSKQRWMPAETIGDKSVTNSEEGYRIISGAKHKLYGPDGKLIGIYDTQTQAERKADATQARLQPEVDQQQRLPRNEGRQTAEAGGRNRAVGGQEGQGEGGAVRQAGDVVRTPDETVEPGTPAPDSGIDDIPLTGSPIRWDTAPEISQVRFMPEIDRNAFPTMDQSLFARLKEQTGTLAAIHIDRLRVGKYKDVDLQGGMFYPAIKENRAKGVVWAFNSTGVARAVAKRAADNNGFVKLVLMQEGNVIGNKTFTHIWFNDLKENIQNGLVSKSAALRELNDVRSKFAKHKNDKLATGHSKSWKTLDEAFNDIVSMPQQKRASTYFQKSKTETKSEGEKIAYQSLLSKKMTGSGFPDAIKIVEAIEEPAFKGVPSGAAVGIIQIDPLSTDSPILTGKEAGVPEHLSYEYVLKGKPVAKLGFYSVVEQIAPETKGKIMSQAQVNFPIEKSIPQAAEAAGQLRFMPAGDMATGRGVKDHREAMDLFEKGYRLYGALYDGMEDPIRLKKASEIERFDPENLWAVPSKKIAAAISVRNMPASDTDYLSAVKAGDTAAAQRMVDEAAKAAGVNQEIDPSKIRTFWRVGKPPEGGQSYNSKDQFFEKGVSTYFYPEATSFAGMDRSDWYKVSGEFIGYGSDGEPLVKVESFKKGTQREIDAALKKKPILRLGPGDSFRFPKYSNYADRFTVRSVKRRKDGSLYGYEISSSGIAKDYPIGTEIPNYRKFGPEYLADDELGITDITYAPITRDDQGNVVPLSQRFKATSEDIRFMPDYSGEHKAPQRDSGAPLDNLKDVYPDDVYGPKGALYYGHASGDATDKAAIRIIQSARNKPDAPVKVFRAIPKGIQSNEINPGDWITTIKSYAVQHGEGPLGGDYKILEKTVPAGDLYTNGDSIFEFGYDPKFMPETIQRDVGRNQDFANPPTDTEAVDALSSEKKAKFGAARSIKPGTQVAARIDIPAFLRTGKYVVAVHEPDGAAGGPGKVIGYDTVTRLQNPKFVVKPGVQRIYEGKSAKFPVATVDGKIMADRSIPGDLENYVPVGMDPKEHAYFYDKRTDQPVIGGSESVSVGNTVFVKNPVYGDPSQFAFMPSPDSAMPGAYSFSGGYRALPGKAKGSLRIYGPAGSLLGIASSLDEAQRIIRKKAKQ